MVEATGEDKPPPDEDDVWRIKGSKGLRRKSLAFLRELWHWREGEAREANLPPFKIMGNRLLIEIALHAPFHPDFPFSRGGPRLPQHLSKKAMDRFKETLARARKIPGSKWPSMHRQRKNNYTPLSRSQARKVELLRGECAHKAKELGIPPSVIASRASLESLVRDGSSTLMPWQADLLQEGIVRILES
jgi:ribonuclease D